VSTQGARTESGSSTQPSILLSQRQCTLLIFRRSLDFATTVLATASIFARPPGRTTGPGGLGICGDYVDKSSSLTLDDPRERWIGAASACPPVRRNSRSVRRRAGTARRQHTGRPYRVTALQSAMARLM
jgi:hypothetical protein